MHAYCFVFVLILSVVFVPAMAQVDPRPEVRPTIEGKPLEPIECVKTGEECEPNTRIIIFAIYDNSRDQNNGEKLRGLLESQKTIQAPRVVETPIQKTEQNGYEIVTTSFEFTYGEGGKADTIKQRMEADRLLSGADFVRVTTFNTWHHFGDDHLRPCEIIDVIEFGDSNLIIEI